MEPAEGRDNSPFVRHIIRSAPTLAQLQELFPRVEAVFEYWKWHMLYYVCIEWPGDAECAKRVGPVVQWLTRPPNELDVNAYCSAHSDIVPMILAVRRYHWALIHALLDAGADLNRVLKRYVRPSGNYPIPIEQWPVESWTVLDEVLSNANGDSREDQRRFLVCYLLDLGACSLAEKLPDYAEAFLKRYRELRGLCFMLLMHHRRRIPSDMICRVDRHVWSGIIRRVWAKRFETLFELIFHLYEYKH